MPKEKFKMSNTNNSNVKLGMYKEPIEVGDWCLHDNLLCKVIKINEKKITLVKLDDGQYWVDEYGTIAAWKVAANPENIFIIAKDDRDMPKYLKPKVDAIDRRFLEETSPKF